MYFDLCYRYSVNFGPAVNKRVDRKGGGRKGEEVSSTCVMRMGSEKSPPDDDVSVGGAGRSFLGGGGPVPGFADVCLASSAWRRDGLDGPDLEPEEF